MDWSILKSTAQSYLPPWVSRPLRTWTVRARYRQQREACREAYLEHGERYVHPILFIAGLPKSGTTWMERMLSSYPGYQEIMIPEAIEYEVGNRGSHDFELPADVFERLSNLLAVLKLHVHGSPHNADVLRDANVPYLIMYRDLRDVAVSHVFYVQRTPWHPEHPKYKGLSIEEGLRRFGETLLPEFVEWIRSWHANRDPESSLVVRYEDLLADTTATFCNVARLFGLPDDPGTIQPIVDEHRFENLSGGRNRGEDEEDSFFRKGVSGDWKNHFTPDLKRLYKEKAGQALIDFGYETEMSW
ncbi:sulfotransferase domain-containing protein [Salinibacter ruber]|uniref:sulfotransferase domain-containing protein n=1 Tax=Salinibacter ruber TaxID=146919 RepID=UPI00216736A7|nr:sulfotransferase domain-containing protein [Salinibacter ruber]